VNENRNIQPKITIWQDSKQITT